MSVMAAAKRRRNGSVGAITGELSGMVRAHGARQHGVRQIVSYPLEKIHRHPHNRQIDPRTCEGLSESLARRSLLTPLRVRTVDANWDLPEGHVQLIDGERRYVAASLLGWESIDCEVVSISDQEAEAEIAAANGHRQALNEIEIADRLAYLQRPAVSGGGGLTQTQAAAEMGISQSYASLLQSVARLPECWRSAVCAGEIPGSFLRPVARYADCPEFLGLLWDRYRKDVSSADAWVEACWSSRRGVEETVDDVLRWHTRALTREDLLDNERHSLPRFEAAGLSPADLAKLRIERLPVDGRELSRCLDCDAWDLLNDAARDADASQGGRQRSARSAAKRPRTAEQSRELEAKSDRQLLAQICGPGGLREIALRIAMRRQLLPGHWVTAELHDELAATAKGGNGFASLDYARWRYAAQRLVLLERDKRPQVGKCLRHVGPREWSKASLAALAPEGDPLSDGERRRWWICRLILWPVQSACALDGMIVCEGEWPESFPWIDLATLEDYAQLAGARVGQCWDHARQAGTLERGWLVQFIRKHSTLRQRGALCEELGVEVCGKDKQSELLEKLLAAHQEHGLRLPKVLGDAKGKKGGKRG